MQNPLEVLFGLSEQHLTQVESGDDKSLAKLHCRVVNDFVALQAAAQSAGFNLQIASGFRGFERQVMIWNRKFSGQTPCFDKQGKPHDFSSYSDTQKTFAILEYSALPGLSRHHWGTDFDYYDPTLLGGAQLQLIPNEYEETGVFAPLNEWLTDNMGQFGFFRPYREDCGGVAREPWHLSHLETSQTLTSDLAAAPTSSLLNALQQHNTLGFDAIAENIDVIVERFGLNICLPDK